MKRILTVLSRSKTESDRAPLAMSGVISSFKLAMPIASCQVVIQQKSALGLTSKVGWNITTVAYDQPSGLGIE